MGDRFPPLIFALILLHAIDSYIRHYLRPNAELNALFGTMIFGDVATLSILPTFWNRPVKVVVQGVALALANCLQLFHCVLGMPITNG